MFVSVNDHPTVQKMCHCWRSRRTFTCGIILYKKVPLLAFSPQTFTCGLQIKKFQLSIENAPPWKTRILCSLREQRNSLAARMFCPHHCIKEAEIANKNRP